MLKDAFTTFATSVTASSVREQQQIIDNLIIALDLSKEPLPDLVVKKTLKLLIPAAIFRYSQKKSLHLVLKIIIKLAQNNPETALDHLSNCIDANLGHYDSNFTTETIAKSAYFGVKWICAILRMKKSDDWGKDSLKSASSALSSCCFLASISNKLTHLIVQKLTVILHNDAGFCDRFLGILPSLDSLLEKRLCFISALINSGNENELKLTSMAVDSYIKAIILSKIRHPIHILRVCGSFLRSVSHETFGEIIMPNIKKAMLRSPEIAIFGLAQLLSQITLEMSRYSIELLKSLSTQLSSNNDVLRDESASAISYLAKQCSDEDTIRELLLVLFTLLADGKLILSSHRLSVLMSTVFVSQHSVAGAEYCDSLSLFACEKYALILMDETHEATILVILDGIKRWALRFSKELPELVSQLFKNGLNPNARTGVVRLAYLRCMIAVYQKQCYMDSLLTIAADLQLLFEIARKQTHSFSEALAATVLMLMIHRYDRNNGTKLRSFESVWKLAIEVRLFTDIKWVLSLDDHVYCPSPCSCALLLTDFVERLILDRPLDFVDHAYPPDACRTLVLLLLWPSFDVRKRAQTTLKRILPLFEGPAFACKMLQHFLAVVDEGVLTEMHTKVADKILCECLLNLTKLGDQLSNESIENVALASLLPSCLPSIVAHDGRLWLKILTSISNDFRHILLDESFANRVNKLVFECSSIEMARNAVRLLVSFGSDGESIRLLLWKQLDHDLTALNTDKLLSIDEYKLKIWQCPRGTLCDTSILQNLHENGTEEQKNLKRESKIYSYKEQMACLAIQKELDADKKRKRAGERILTEAEKVVVNEQLTSENAVRDELQQCKVLTRKPLVLYEVAIGANPSGGTVRIGKTLNILLSLLHCPLIADDAINCYLAIRDACFDESDDHLPDLVAYCSLRLSGVPTVPFEWTEEDLEVQTKRTIHLLNARHSADPLSSAAFAFCFPLVKIVLTDSNLPEQLRINALDFIEAHLQPNTERSIYSPHVFPLAELANLLINLMGEVDLGELLNGSANCALKLARLVRTDQSGMDVSDFVRTVAMGLLDEKRVVREYVLNLFAHSATAQMLLDLRPLLVELASHDHVLLEFLIRRVAVSRHDPDEDCSSLGDRLWTECAFQLDAQVCDSLLVDVVCPLEFVSNAAAMTLYDVLEVSPESAEMLLQKLAAIYVQKNQSSTPTLSDFGRSMPEHVDDWQSRSGVATCLKSLCPLLPSCLVDFYFSILVPDAVMDRHSHVRDLMRDAAVEGVRQFGETHRDSLLANFETLLADIPDGSHFDPLRQTLVVLLGSLARHLSSDQPKVRVIVGLLIETLSTPSQSVQESVATVLAPLVPAIKDQAKTLSNTLLRLLLTSKTYGERRGAAYGIAGLVKGLGILSLHELELMTALQEALVEQKNPLHREGALLALETLCNMLGKLFEPYVVQVLPSLLVCFGDQNEHVRKVTTDHSHGGDM